jgi:hypothetical protein
MVLASYLPGRYRLLVVGRRRMCSYRVHGQVECDTHRSGIASRLGQNVAALERGHDARRQPRRIGMHGQCAVGLHPLERSGQQRYPGRQGRIEIGSRRLVLLGQLGRQRAQLATQRPAACCDSLENGPAPAIETAQRVHPTKLLCLTLEHTAAP